MFADSHPCADSPDLAVPASLAECLQILWSDHPYYRSIRKPSKEQVDNLNASIRCLLLQLHEGVDEATGDKTAYELAVAMLWHSDTSLIEEGVLLMEYLLKERWNQYWSMAIRTRPSAATSHGQDEDNEGVRRDVVEKVSGEDNRNEEGADIVRSLDQDQCVNSNHAAAVAHLCSADRTSTAITPSPANSGERVILRGSAVQFATAPPPPENEYGSVPPSLVRGREQSSTLTQGGPDTRFGSSFSCFSSAPVTSTEGKQQSWNSTHTGMSTETPTTEKSSLDAADVHSHYDRLAECCYNLAVGYTKLRKNKKALFYVGNALRLSHCTEEVLLLRRLLCARQHVRNFTSISAMLVAYGLLLL
ncbi:hypothetical protein, conserved [Leishmania tarentolae]|uniref:Uncharacterized protein n=1 Tax=Leishmania tarentolae TaxID=5689 RepID=A0A640KXI3_LEITA|nr:hypothetical protein, conserved [Leishmania tarentolae]